MSTSMTDSAPGGRLGGHLRRYRLFYALVVVWAVTVTTFPVLRDDAGDDPSLRAAAPQEAATAGDTAVAPPGIPSAQQPLGQTTPSRTGAPGSAGSTSGGKETCVRPTLASVYARPCLPTFSGDNGGATSPGVTATKIRIVSVRPADTAAGAAVDAFYSAAGYGATEEWFEVQRVLIRYLSRVTQLYGRTVEHIEATLEHEDSDREGACADAARIVERHRPFAVLGAGANLGACLAQRKVTVLRGAQALPESYYAAHHPYVWTQGVDCHRIAHLASEYVGRRLAGRPARRAGQADLARRTRRFGLYAPDDDQVRPCVEVMLDRLRADYGVQPVVVYYRVDVARLAEQAQQAILKFKSEDVTSLLLAADMLSTTYLTQSASAHGWRPEWVTLGVGNVTDDISARQYDQSQVDGHMFGMSVWGPLDQFFGPNGEPGRIYQQETGRPIPKYNDGWFFYLVGAFDLLQGAGPVLTPETIARGARTLPSAGHAHAPMGMRSFSSDPTGAPGVDHSWQDGLVEVFWDGRATAHDGSRGLFRHTYGGRFFTNGQWPPEEPPIYPDR
jgi:hypothetical protein